MSAPYCICQEKNHKPKLVVLTGGPGAGKTAILEMARRHFCHHTEILPESASIIFGGGFIRKPTVIARKAGQRAIFHVQRELESLVIEEGQAGIVLCDRGTIDGLAYWPETAQTFWQSLGTTLSQELSRYDAVIHLKTPGLQSGYNHQNPFRIETPEEAHAIDQKILKAWEGHPRRIIIESTEDFLEKARQTLSAMSSFMPACCLSEV